GGAVGARARVRDPWQYAPAGDEGARQHADRESRRGLRLDAWRAHGGDPRPRHQERRVHQARPCGVEDVSAAPGSRVLILDCGSQFTQLIARRVREARVFSEIHPPDRSVEWIRAWEPTAIILSGGPNSVTDPGA